VPGLAQVAPLQRLLLEHGKLGAGERTERVKHSVEFAARLQQAGALYFAASPLAKSRMESFKRLDPRYLAHEYYNDNWSLFYHADVARDMAEMVRASIEERGLAVYETSVATRNGVQALAYAMADAVRAARAAMPPAEPTRVVLRPTAVDDAGFTVTQDGDGFVVRGERVERWVRQTNFDNDEAVGYLADRLARVGVEAELVRQGAEAGAEVTIGDWTFDWEPATEESFAATRRGEDVRFAPESSRVPADERLAAKKARRERTEE